MLVACAAALDSAAEKDRSPSPSTSTRVARWSGDGVAVNDDDDDDDDGDDIAIAIAVVDADPATAVVGSAVDAFETIAVTSSFTASERGFTPFTRDTPMDNAVMSGKTVRAMNA